MTAVIYYLCELEEKEAVERIPNECSQVFPHSLPQPRLNKNLRQAGERGSGKPRGELVLSLLGSQAGGLQLPGPLGVVHLNDCIEEDRLTGVMSSTAEI